MWFKLSALVVYDLKWLAFRRRPRVPDTAGVYGTAGMRQVHHSVKEWPSAAYLSYVDRVLVTVFGV